MVYARQLLAIRKGMPFPYIREPIMAKLLLKRIHKTKIDTNPLLSTIDRTAQLMKDEHQLHTDVPKDGIMGSLCMAAVIHLGSTKAAKQMISESDGRTQSTDDLMNLLTAAAFLGNLSMVKSLLSRGANVNSRSEYFGAPLQAAIDQGHYDIVLLLLEQGADVNYVGGYGHIHAHVCGDRTALRAASCRNRRSIILLLLEPRYSLKTSGIDYENALLDAAYAGHADLVQFLLAKGTFDSIENMQFKVLLTCSRRGHLRLVQMMLDKGVDVNGEDFECVHALEHAVSSGDVYVVSLLLEKGADLSFAGSGMDAINRAASNGYIPVMQILLDYGANINSVQWKGRPPLFEAAKNRHSSMVRFLLDRGADLEVAECGEDAFFFAVEHGYEEVVHMLVEAGVNVDGPPEYSESEPAPMLYAMRQGHDHIVNLLLELGAKRVDPLQSMWAEKFRNGTYPLQPPPPPLLKP